MPVKSCRCSSNSISPFKCSLCTDSEVTKGYDHNTNKFLIGYELHLVVTPLVDNQSPYLPLTFFVAGSHVHDSKMTANFSVYIYHDMQIDFNYVILDSAYNISYIYL